MNTNFKLIQAINSLKNKIDSNDNEINGIKEEINYKDKIIGNEIEESKKQYELLNKRNKEIIDKIENIKLKEPKNGIDGKDGKDGYTPVKGIDYFDGINGKDGYTPIKGVDYFDGKDGKDGISIRGESGKDGISITDVEIDKKGHLIVYLSNGKKKDVGIVKGKDGIGFRGVSVLNVEVKNNDLLVTLSNNEIINAGHIESESGNEIDPIFTNSPSYTITTEDITNWNNKSNFSGNYEDLINKPTIPTVPTNISSFNNDVGYCKITYYDVELNPNGTVNTYSQDLLYDTVLENLTNSKTKDVLSITWVSTNFLIEATELTSGDIKFIGDIEFDGIQRRMVFTLNSNNELVTTLITTNEIVSNKRTSIGDNLSNEFYPSTMAVYNEFQRKPVLIYDKVGKLHVQGTITSGTDGDNGLLNQNQGEGTNRKVTSWNITGMDLSPFKRIRVVYSRNDETSAVTGDFFIPLDADYITNNNLNIYVNGASLPYYAVRTRLVGINCAISSDKTSFSVTQTISLTATTLGMVATTVNDMFVTKIEGYYD